MSLRFTAHSIHRFIIPIESGSNVPVRLVCAFVLRYTGGKLTSGSGLNPEKISGTASDVATPSVVLAPVSLGAHSGLSGPVLPAQMHSVCGHLTHKSIHQI